ncbi:MAG: aminotransferase class V-fold PLP-dependent enzyme [Acidimicrobiaceae bacterium]|nr:aminotransferase class V-fold PLP-dependent enzyme [Acidimicrobiaceae bacterium]
MALLQLQNRHGIEVVLIEDDEHGQIDLQHLEAELARGAAMVAMTHAPTNGGLINPAEAVGGLCKQYDVFYVLTPASPRGRCRLMSAASVAMFCRGRAASTCEARVAPFPVCGTTGIGTY